MNSNVNFSSSGLIPFSGSNRLLKQSNCTLNIQSIGQWPKVILYTAKENNFYIHRFCITLAASTIQNEMIKKIYIRFFNPSSFSNSSLEYEIDLNGKSINSNGLTHIIIGEKEFPDDYRKVMAPKPFALYEHTKSFQERMKECTRFICIKFHSTRFEYEHTSRVLPLTVVEAKYYEFQGLYNFVMGESMRSCIDLETFHPKNFLFESSIKSPVCLLSKNQSFTELPNSFSTIDENIKSFSNSAPLINARVLNVNNLKTIKSIYKKIILFHKKENLKVFIIPQLFIEIALFNLKKEEIRTISIELSDPKWKNKKSIKLSTFTWDMIDKTEEGKDVLLIKTERNETSYFNVSDEILPEKIPKLCNKKPAEIAMNSVRHLSVNIENVHGNKKDCCISNVLLFPKRSFQAEGPFMKYLKAGSNNQIFLEFLKSDFMTSEPTIQEEPTKKRRIDHVENKNTKKKKLVPKDDT